MSFSNGDTRECRRCHRIGPGQFSPVGGEGWECSNDRACNRRRDERIAAAKATGKHSPDIRFNFAWRDFRADCFCGWKGSCADTYASAFNEYTQHLAQIAGH